MKQYRIAAIPGDGTGIDWVVIGENTEGEYSGSGGSARTAEVTRAVCDFLRQ